MRQNILISEKAYAYKMKLESMKRQERGLIHVIRVFLHHLILI